MRTMSKLCEKCLNREEDWVSRPHSGEVEKVPFCMYNKPVFPSALKCTQYEPIESVYAD